MKGMIVKNLELRLTEYGDDKGKLKGKVEFVGVLGGVTLAIDADKAAKIITILAEEMVATAQDVAGMMVGQIIDQAKANVAPMLEGAAA